MNKWKTPILCLTLLLAVLMLGGCSESDTFEPTANTLYIRKDGTLTEAVFDRLDKDYYNGSELQTFIEDAVKEYNSEKTGKNKAYAGEGETLPVAVAEYLTEGTTVKLVLDFASAEDYTAFNAGHGLVEDLEFTTVEHVNFGSNMKKPNGDSVDAATVSKKGAQHAVIATGKTLVQVQGKVTYMSGNVTKAEKNLVTIDAMDEPAYIVFK